MKVGKLAQSATNSVKATPRGTHQFMGQTYQNEKDLTHVMSEPVGKVYPGHGWPSLTSVYKIDYWLKNGVRAGKLRPNETEKEQIIKKYGLIWHEKLNRYTTAPSNIFEIALQNYVDRFDEWAITSYGELEYRATHR